MDAVLRLLGPSASTVREAVKAGDWVRFTSINSNLSGAGRLVRCGSSLTPPTGLEADFAIPFLEEAVYQGAKERVALYDEAYEQAANDLIGTMQFDSSQFIKMVTPSPQDYCFEPAYMIQEDSYTCPDSDVCSAKVTVAGGIILVAAGKRLPLQVGVAMSLKDFMVDQKENYFLWEAFKRFEGISAELAEKVH